MNESPEVHDVCAPRTRLYFEEGKLREVSPEAVFELVRDIQDPEHPYTLERLGVVRLESVEVSMLEPEGEGIRYQGLPMPRVDVSFCPTVPHCSMAGIIGLAIKHQLMTYVRPEYWIRIFIQRDTHVNWRALNKQLNDRERVMAALENESMLEMLSEIVPSFEH